MSESGLDKIRYSKEEVEVTSSSGRRQDVANRSGVCPECGKRGTGPYTRRVGKGAHCGLYYKHSINGRDVWHYVPKGRASKRREELVRLLHAQGFRGLGHFARLMGVCTKTIQRDLNALQSEGRVIHKPYGTYIADPSGELLKEKPWLAWTD